MSAGFIFDIIIVKIDCPNVDLQDQSLLSVGVLFNDVSLQITSSRINVLEFRSGRSYEFDARPDDLRCDLESTPLQLVVKYDNATIGRGEMPWPSFITDQITSSVGELTHVDECDLNDMDDTKIGTVELIVRLQVKCQEMCDELLRDADDIRRNLHKVINPHDILFVVGEPMNEEDECMCIKNSNENENRRCGGATALDLSRYRSVNGKTLKSADILNTCNNHSCCDLKKVSNQYQELIDVLQSSECSKQKSRKPARKCCKKEHNSSSADTSVGSDNVNMHQYAANNTDDEVFKKFLDLLPQLTSCTKQQADPVQSSCSQMPRRFCPVCKENIGWLPKTCACPKCGYKSPPEKPPSEKLTPEQILKECLDRCSSGSDKLSTCAAAEKAEKEKDANKCRCSCGTGKVCANCRIKKLCAEMFGNGSNKSEEKVVVQQNDESVSVCDENAEKDCRPYLAQVFSELRDLYDIKETKDPEFKINERCEAELNGWNKKKPKKKRKPKAAKQQNNNDSSPQMNCNDLMSGTIPNVSDNVKTVARPTPKKKKLFVTGDRLCPIPAVNTHVSCKSCPPRKNVPRHMGWLWNINPDNVRSGWKPGAIRKSVRQMMRYFLKDYPADTIRVSPYGGRRVCPEIPKPDPPLIQRPTLHICKKNDEYIVTLRPLKDSQALKTCADPYLNMKPIQFKITKNPAAMELRKIKASLKEMGFSKCTCHKPISSCYCRSFLDKKRLEYQANKECRKRCLPNCAEKLVLSDTTESDVEFDFGVTPPAGVIKPNLLKKPNVVNHGTQYADGDWNVPPLYPKTPNKYMRLYNCATGDRYAAYGSYGYGGYGGGGAGYDAAGGGGPGGRGGRGGGRGGRGGGVGGAGGGRGGGGAGGGAGGGRSGAGGGGGGGAGGGGAGGGGGGGRGGRANGGAGGPGNKMGGKGGGVDMMKYMKGRDGGKGGKGGQGGQGGAGTEGEGKKGMRRSGGDMPPPLLCMIDRRAKPFDPCCPPPCCPRIC